MSKSRKKSQKKSRAVKQLTPRQAPPVFTRKALNVEQVAVDQLTAHPAQPPRHSEAQCQDLLGIILETGIIDPIVVVPVGTLAYKPEDRNKYYVVNGNRRLTVARLLGVTTMDCIVLDPAATEAGLMRLWSLFNGGARKISGKEIFWSWASIPTMGDRRKYLAHIATWNQTIANQIEKLMAFVGEEKAISYALTTTANGDVKFSPNVVVRVSDLLREAESQGRPEYQTPTFIRQMVAWFYRHNMYREVGDTKKLMPTWGGAYPQLFDAIMDAVINNKPFSLSANISVDTPRPIGQTKTAQVFSNLTAALRPTP
jgi:hypothetical protein